MSTIDIKPNIRGSQACGHSIACTSLENIPSFAAYLVFFIALQVSKTPTFSIIAKTLPRLLTVPRFLKRHALQKLSRMLGRMRYSDTKVQYSLLWQVSTEFDTVVPVQGGRRGNMRGLVIFNFLRREGVSIILAG
jgi:hypothetical protein